MKEIYYLFLLVITALGSSAMTHYAPAMLARIKRLFTRKKRTSQPDCNVMEHNIEVLVERMNQLEEQMDNVAQNSYRREQNRKNNIRREVRSYLEELKK